MTTGLDSGILQYVPKGAYYEGTDEQFAAVKRMWEGLFDYDRALFALTSILNGTGFSKGAMTHMLLSNPVKSETGMDIVPDGLDAEFERKIVMYNLYRLADKQMARAIKNLLMLAGGERHERVNNSRTRNIILEFIFNRPMVEQDALAINFKSKLSKLVRHALGKQDLYKILNGDVKLFRKMIGKYNMYSFPVVCHLFNIRPVAIDQLKAHTPMIDAYWEAKTAAQNGDVKEFKKLINKLPWRVCMGFKNSYKLPIDNADIMGKATMSQKETLTTQAAVKRTGAKKRKIDYNTQDLYDLWKALYFKIGNDDLDDVDEISDAINHQTEKLKKIDLGRCVVVLDASHSMYGSDERPMHPFLTGLCIASSIKNVEQMMVIGGKWKTLDDKPDKAVVFPANASPLWRGLVDAVVTEAPNIVVISDGYENAVKGMFEHVYKYFKGTGYKFNVIHINPVFAANSKSGTTRKLAEDVTPMPVGSYKYLETEFIFNQLLDNTEAVKQLLVNKYKQLIGGAEV